MINELAGNIPDFFTPFLAICCIEFERIRPFSLISSMRNHGMMPFSQYSTLDFDGV